MKSSSQKTSRKKNRSISDLKHEHANQPKNHRKESSELHWFLLVSAALLVLIVISHAPALQSQALSLDDDAFLVDNPLVKNPEWRSIKQFFFEVLSPSTVKGYYIPLTMTSLMADYAIGGRPGDLAQFHITSLVLHFLVVCLIVASFGLLFENRWAALTAGLIVAVHPLTVEPVVWIAERKTMLAGFWSMMSIFTYLYSIRAVKPRWLWISIASYLAAILSKPTAVPLPLILMILDGYPLKRLNLKAVIEKIPFFVLMAASATITLISHARTASVDIEGLSTPGRAILLIFYNLTFYIWKLLVPVNLSSCYPPPIPFSLNNPFLSGAVGIVIVITAAAVMLYRRYPIIMTGWLVYITALIPTAGLVSYSWVVTSDKYIYPLPLVGLLLPPAAFLRYLLTDSRSSARRYLISAVVFLATGACMIQTRTVYSNWRDTETLYRHMIDASPRVALLHNNLGLELARQNRHAEAIDSYRTALSLSPDFTGTMNNYGLSLMATGQYQEALEQFRHSLKTEPDYWLANNNIAYILTMMGRLDEAKQAAQAALEAKPDSGGVLINLGRIHALQQEYDDAIKCFTRAIEINPTLHTAWSNLGAMHVGKREFAEAERCYRQALTLRPDFVEGLSNFGRMKNHIGQFVEAESLFRQALSLNPQFIPALAGLGQSLAGQNRYSEAGSLLQKAESLAPKDPEIQRLLSELPN